MTESQINKAARVAYANYCEPENRHYRGNPFIEALGPVLDAREAGRLLRTDLDYSVEDCQASPRTRMSYVLELLNWRLPSGEHIRLERLFSDALRTGYRGRNPAEISYWSDLREAKEALAANLTLPPRAQSMAVGFSVIGDSGVGKTAAIRSISQLYPEVIIHSSYNGKDLNFLQLPIVIVQCPPQGGLASLCYNIFSAIDRLLGTNYLEKYSRRKSSLSILGGYLLGLVYAHGIGIIVVDEIQNLTEAKQGEPEAMLNFFVMLINALSIPIVVVGTPKAVAILSTALRNARRFSGFDDPVFRRMRPGQDFDRFIRNMMKYQYVQNRVDWTPELSEAIYYNSLGITDLIVKVYILAQIRAISSEIERLTPQIIYSVEDNLTVLKPMLEALRSGDDRAMEAYDDLYDAIDIQGNVYRATATLSVVNDKGDNQDLVSDEQENHEGEITDLAPIQVTPSPSQTINVRKKSPGSTSRRQSKRKKLIFEGGLIHVTTEARRAKVAVYDALVEADYIQDLNIYLD
ncbi:MAG: TniB family NTP-binding protein [Chloroflexota bacterium]